MKRWWYNTGWEKITFWKRCLYLIPNIVVLLLYSCVLYVIIWTIHIILNPSNLFYKSLEYDNWYSILFIVSIIIWLIMLFVPARKKMYSVSKSFILWLSIFTFLLYLITNFTFQQELEMQKIQYQNMQREQANKAAQQRWYNNMFDEIRAINPTN